MILATYLHRAQSITLEDFMKSKTIVKAIKVTKSVEEDQILRYGEKWCEIHPVYSLTSTNCQMFVNDVCHEIFECEFESQTEIVRKFLWQTYLKVVTASFVIISVAFGFFYVLAPFFPSSKRNTHIN